MSDEREKLAVEYSRRHIRLLDGTPVEDPVTISNFLAGYAARDAEVEELKCGLKNLRSVYNELCAEWNEVCEQGCDDYHEEKCKNVNLGEAKKAMRLANDRLRREVACLREGLEGVVIEDRLVTGYDPVHGEEMVDGPTAKIAKATLAAADRIASGEE